MFLGQMLALLKHVQLCGRAHVCLCAFAYSACSRLYSLFVSVWRDDLLCVCSRTCRSAYVFDFWLLGYNKRHVD